MSSTSMKVSLPRSPSRSRSPRLMTSSRISSSWSWRNSLKSPSDSSEETMTSVLFMGVSVQDAGGARGDGERLERALAAVAEVLHQVTDGLVQLLLLLGVHPGGARAALDPTEELDVLAGLELVLEDVAADGALVRRLVREENRVAHAGDGVRELLAEDVLLGDAQVLLDRLHELLVGLHVGVSDLVLHLGVVDVGPHVVGVLLPGALDHRFVAQHRAVDIGRDLAQDPVLRLREDLLDEVAELRLVGGEGLLERDLHAEVEIHRGDAGVLEKGEVRVLLRLVEPGHGGDQAQELESVRRHVAQVLLLRRPLPLAVGVS